MGDVTGRLCGATGGIASDGRRAAAYGVVGGAEEARACGGAAGWAGAVAAGLLVERSAARDEVVCGARSKL